jgi:hypothetical protein
MKNSENQGPGFMEGMEKINRTLFFIVGGLLTFLIIYLIVRVLVSDYTQSVIPGWHTTIWTGQEMIIALTVVILINSLITYFVFIAIVRLLKKVWPTGTRS